MSHPKRGIPHDYDVHALDKYNDRIKGRVGRAWVKDGHISVVFDAFVVIHGGQHAVTLFPAGRFNKEQTDDT
jgi:hypothetical protein